MSTFAYVGRNRQGAVKKGELTAKTRDEAVDQLRKQQVVVTSLEEKSGMGGTVSYTHLDVYKRQVLDTVLWLYMWVIIARALISWVNPDPWNPIVQFLERATEPVLTPIRRLVGWRMGMDLSPMIAILILVFLQYAVVQSLRDIAVRMH